MYNDSTIDRQYFTAVLAFSLHARICGGGRFEVPFFAYAFFPSVCLSVCPSVFFFLFFPKWRSARAHQLRSLSQDQSTVVQRAETTVDEGSGPDDLRVSSFPLVGSHKLPGQHSQAHSRLCWVKRVWRCLSVTCHLHFWQNDRGLLHATAAVKLVFGL